MEESSWIKSAVRFAIVVILLAVVLFGGVYLLKHRNNSSSNHTPNQVSKSNTNEKKSNKKSKNSKQHSESKSNDKNSSTNKTASQSPHKVAPAGISDYWYIPILGAVALGFAGYEYYLSRQALKQVNSTK